MSSADSPARMSYPQLLAYGLLGLPLAALGLPLYVYLPTFYADDLALSLSAVGGVLLAARLVDMVTDPLVGVGSDLFPTRWGRRLPWLLVGAPLLMLGGWQLFVPPAEVGIHYLLGWSLLTYLGWTLVILPYTALGAELSADYHQRSRITASREGFVILGTLLAVGLPGLLEYQGETRAAALEALAWVLVTVIPVAALLLVFGVGEPAGEKREPPPWRDGLKILKQNLPFRRLLAAFLLNSLANGLPASLFLLFVTHVLQQQEWSGIYLAVYFLAGVLTLPVWLKLAQRFGKHRVWVASMIWASLIFAWVPFLGAGDAWAFMVICVLSGASLGVDQAIPASIQADVIDEDTASGGGGRAGLYFGLWSMATKLSLALAVGVAFPLLELAGFDASADSNDAQSLLALALLYGGLPVAFKLVAMLLLRNFPLDESRQAELRQRIAQQ
ncbi:MAG: MFS transporter [Gammaproteobacteria bacterium]|nr:MFS transporter [Gammaproteobacteria bacterium]